LRIITEAYKSFLIINCLITKVL